MPQPSGIEVEAITQVSTAQGTEGCTAVTLNFQIGKSLSRPAQRLGGIRWSGRASRDTTGLDTRD